MVRTSSNLTISQLKRSLSSAVNSASIGHQRIGITRHGKLAAIIIGANDLELLESLEDASDLAAYRAAKAEDDGVRISLDESRWLELD